MALNDRAELSCLVLYRRIVHLLRICASVCGADVTAPEYRINAATYTIFILLFNFYFCTIYTIYTSIVTDGDYSVILQTISFVGGATQGSVKLFCFIWQRDQVQESQTFLDNTYMEYEKLEGDYKGVLLDGIDSTMKAIKVFVVVYLGVVVGCTGFPLVYYAFYNKQILIMQFLVPFVDQNTTIGYCCLSALQFVSLSLGAFGNFAGDMYLLIFIGSVPLVKNILGCKLNDLNDLMDREHQPTGVELRTAMVGIVLWHKEYLSLQYRAQRIFFVIIIAQVVSSFVSVLSTMYCLLAGDWPAAPVYLIFSFMTLYLYCGLGTVVDKSNDDCAKVIYTQCRWYNLPASEQRFLLLMLSKSQTTPCLSVGNMMPLNVNTALHLTKAVYSMVMLLMRNEDK